MIRYLEKQNLLILETERTSYWIGLAYPAPVCLHWGRKIAPEDADMFEPIGGHSSFDTESWRERMEYPAFDGRTFENVSLKADVPLNLRTTGVRVQGQQAEITLADEANVMEVCLMYRVFEDCDVIEKRARLTANAPVRLTRMDSGACLLPHEAKPWTAHYVVGAWAGEFRRRTAKLEEGELRLQSVRGMSGPHMNPFLIAANSEDEETGEAYGVALGWSGCWQITASSTVFGNHRITAGLNDADLVCPMERGECFETPPMVLCMSAEGMGALSRRMHDFERDPLKPNRPPRRVLYNSWEATQFDVRADAQMRLAERASRMGVELFVVDDGWFGARHSDRAGLGDWTVNPEKFPNGLEELIDRVHALGMDFGLWVEPESVNPDSDLYRTHPDWIHRLDGREPLTQRNQYLLDFGKPEVERFALDMLRGLLNTYAIRYLKWDMNRAMTDVCESLTPFARERHVLALYRILDALEKEFPDVDIEACSGGGARVDLGMAKRTAQFWVSDNTDPFDRLFIQEGYTLMYAPMMMSCWVTDTPADGRRRGRADWRYKFHAAMCGTLGVGADISRLSDEEMALFTAEIARYKTWRHVVQNGDLYRLQHPSGGNVAATEYVSKDQNEAVLFLFMHSRKYGEVIPRVRLRALREDARYFCKETGKTYAGKTLMNLGLSAELNGDFDSGVFYFQAVKEG